VTNAGTGNIAGFAIGSDGSASLLNADGVTAITGGNPTDMALTLNSRFLYARVAATNSIAGFTVGSDGSLTALPALTGTPDGLVGLAAFWDLRTSGGLAASRRPGEVVESQGSMTRPRGVSKT
jgi:hypothetical protein